LERFGDFGIRHQPESARGTIIRIHASNFEVNGYTHHASAEEPQYEIKNSKTEHVAFHKGSALTKLRG
jgi:hypothetical protein